MRYQPPMGPEAMHVAQDSGNPAPGEPTYGYGEKFKKKVALFRFGWNATFPTRFMVRPVLFAKDFQAGE